MMKMEIKKNCICNDNAAPKLEHYKCSLCGLVNIISAKWYKVDKGFICEYCYEKKRTYLELNATAREKMVKNWNMGMKNWLPRRYLNYYGDYLFGETVELNHLENVYDEGGNKNEMYL